MKVQKEEIIKRAKDVVQEELGVEPDLILVDETFYNLGADSLDIIELLIAVEKEFDLDISDADADKALETFGTLTEYLTTRLTDG